MMHHASHSITPFTRPVTAEAGAQPPLHLATPSDGSEVSWLIYCPRGLAAELRQPRIDFPQDFEDAISRFLHANGGLMVLADATRSTITTLARSMGDYAPPRRVMVLQARGGIRWLEIVAGDSRRESEFAPGEHAVVPVDEAAEADLAQLERLVRRFPADRQDLILDSIRHPTLEALLARMDRRYGRLAEKLKVEPDWRPLPPLPSRKQSAAPTARDQRSEPREGAPRRDSWFSGRFPTPEAKALVAAAAFTLGVVIIGAAWWHFKPVTPEAPAVPPPLPRPQPPPTPPPKRSNEPPPPDPVHRTNGDDADAPDFGTDRASDADPVCQAGDTALDVIVSNPYIFRKSTDDSTGFANAKKGDVLCARSRVGSGWWEVRWPGEPKAFVSDAAVRTKTLPPHVEP